jgi:hypothetical protein
MRLRAIAVCFLLMLEGAGRSHTDCDLRSPGLAGFAYRNVTETDMDYLGPASTEGFMVI